MAEGNTLFTIDMTGRKAAKLGLSPDNEILVDVVSTARWLHGALARYMVGIVDCDMKKLSAADKSAELSRLWSEAFTHHANLGDLLNKFAPIDAELERLINIEIAAEKKALGEAAQSDSIDKEYRKMMGENPPPDPEEPEDK